MPRAIAKLEMIISKVSGVDIKDIRGKKRTRELVDTRFILWKICKDEFNYAYSSIGRFYSRYHTTIKYGCEKIAENERAMEIIQSIKKKYPDLFGQIDPEAPRGLEGWNI